MSIPNGVAALQPSADDPAPREGSPSRKRKHPATGLQPDTGAKQARVTGESSLRRCLLCLETA